MTLEEYSTINIHLTGVYLVLTKCNLRWGGHFLQELPNLFWKDTDSKYFRFLWAVSQYQLSCCSIKADINSMETKEYGYVSIKPYLQKQVLGWIWTNSLFIYCKETQGKSALFFFFFNFLPHFSKCKIQENVQKQSCGSISIQIISVASETEMFLFFDCWESSSTGIREFIFLN